MSVGANSPLRTIVVTYHIVQLSYVTHYNDVIKKHDGISNHQPYDWLLKRLFRRILTKTSTLRVTGLLEGNSPVIGEFKAQRASNADSVCSWCRHHDYRCIYISVI